MSSFLAKLFLDGETYTILKCKYQFDKLTDPTFKPSGEVVGGKIKLTIESRGHVGLLEWILARDKEKEGYVEFYRRDGMSRQLRIEFKKAFCIRYKEKFNSVGNVPMHISFVIVAQKLKFNHLEFHNDWVI
ncbi:hypothetical protein ETU08_02175 [Apibacter muscae]|uniref:Phage tail protein n=1 Tax=Apibacter muscae TaxID=2509004 RepID=A0A563DMC4_9FLAO|nr:type VI secretion system tube protein TssD [Apibacter muscae]TWP24863.1 hypothetical protein ETU10_02565 [Apibacter muscae]TWP30833.1 hypothetical protein ETU08_02175 [Apibacter muscae]TWP31172.1 hypothetical protein ETU09_00070 [Apibacter muscae]